MAANSSSLIGNDALALWQKVILHISLEIRAQQSNGNFLHWILHIWLIKIKSETKIETTQVAHFTNIV